MGNQYQAIANTESCSTLKVNKIQPAENVNDGSTSQVSFTEKRVQEELNSSSDTSTQNFSDSDESIEVIDSIVPNFEYNAKKTELSASSIGSSAHDICLPILIEKITQLEEKMKKIDQSILHRSKSEISPTESYQNLKFDSASTEDVDDLAENPQQKKRGCNSSRNGNLKRYSDSYKFVGVPGKHFHVTFEPSSANLRSIDLVHVKIDLDLFLDGILLSSGLRFLTLESVFFTKNRRKVMTDFDFLDRLNHLVDLSPKLKDFVTHIFCQDQMQFTIGHPINYKAIEENEDQSEEEDPKYFKFSTNDVKIVATLPNSSFQNILQLIVFQPTLKYCLQALHLMDITLKITKPTSLATAFENLSALSLSNVFFKEKGSKLSPAMPIELFRNFKKLIKLRIFVHDVEQAYNPEIFHPPTGQFPKSLRHIALLDQAQRFYGLPLNQGQFEFSYVFSPHRFNNLSPTPLNTSFLRVDSLLRLEFVLQQYPEELKGIWVQRSLSTCEEEVATEYSKADFLMKSLGIPKTDLNFLLLSNSVEESWRVEYPDQQKTKDLEQKFLVNFEF